MSTLCNLRTEEYVFHFIATGPILAEFRIKFINKKTLSESEFIVERLRIIGIN